MNLHTFNLIMFDTEKKPYFITGEGYSLANQDSNRIVNIA